MFQISNNLNNPALRTFHLCLIGFACLSLTSPAGALVEIPQISSPVLDDGDFFTPSEEQQLAQKLTALYNAGGPQMQIWTLRSLENEPIESLSMRAVEAWKLGRADQDDGLLLSLAREERRFRLEVGQGLEGTIPDVLASRMLKRLLVPALRRGQPADGVTELIAEIAALTVKDQQQLAAGELVKKRPSKRAQLIPSLVFIFFMVALAVSQVVGGHRRLRGRGWSVGGWSGGGRGWPGGGGGWSGGGGGFSGGGSSGSW